MERIFVYGTLMRGLANAGWLVDATFVREASTAVGWLLVDFAHAYPALMPAASLPNTAAGPVEGELWCCDVPTLCRLDVLEGTPHEYLRKQIALDDGSTAWSYIVMPHQLIHHGEPTPIPSGCYRRTSSIR